MDGVTRRRWLGGVLVGAAGWSMGRTAAGTEPGLPGAVAKASGDKTGTSAPPADVRAEVVKYNSAEFAAPPTQFRTGHVTPRQLDPAALTAKDGGFVVQLPSKAPIPTPTVADGKLFVSGGFHSKEYYCLDAKSGKLLWAVDLDDDGPSSAVVSEGVVVFNTESCTLFALDAATGKHLWSHWLGDPLTSTPAVADGLVFTSYPARGGGQQAIGNVPGGQGFGGPIPLPAAEQNQVEPPASQGLQPQAPQPPGFPPGLPPGPAGVPADLPKQQPLPPQGQAPASPNEPAQPREASGKPLPPYSHVLIALDLKTGKIRWQRWIDSDVMSAPVAVDDELHLASFSGRLYKFHQKTGEILAATVERATSAPVIVEKKIFVTRRTDAAAADGGEPIATEAITSVARENLQQRQFQNAEKQAHYLDERVQRASGLAKAGLALDAGNGFGGGAPAQANPAAAFGNVGQGSVSTMQAFQGSRLTSSGTRNFNCMGDEIIASDPSTGQPLWKVKIAGDLAKEGGFLATAPALAGGQIFVATLAGELLQIDPADGKVQERRRVAGPIRFQPAIDGGRAYLGTQDGKVECIDLRDPRLTGWPMWGGDPAHTGLARK